MAGPLAYAVADYTENGFIVAILLGYPDKPAWLATAAGTATTVKTALASSLLVAIVVGYVVAAARRLRPGRASWSAKTAQ